MAEEQTRYSRARLRPLVAAAARIGILVLLAGGGIAIGGWILASYGHNDFAHYYLSSHLLTIGRLPYGVRLDRLPSEHGLTLGWGVVYGTDTPAFLLLFAPLALLPPEPAYYVWSLIQLVSLTVVLLLSLRLVEGRLPSWALRALAAAVVVAFSVWDHFLWSQTQLLLLALVLGAFHLSRRRRHGWALLLVTTAGLLKLYPFAVIPWFAVRAWREDGWRPLLPAALLSTAAIGLAPGLWLDFLRLGLPHVAAFVAGPYPNLSLAGTLERSLQEAIGIQLGDPVVRTTWLLVAALVLGTTYACIWSRPQGAERELAALLCAVLLAVPIAWTHYLVWAIPPLFLLVADVYESPGPGSVMGLVAAYVFTVGAFNELVTRVLNTLGNPAATALGAPTTLTLLILGAWFLVSGPRGEREWTAGRAAQRTPR